MSARLDYNQVDPQGSRALAGLSAYVENSGLERALIDLINVRISQINGCAYCLRLHTEEAVEHGETHRRLHLLRVWAEGPFSARERAALGWAEAITAVNLGPVSDEVYARTREHFSDRDLVSLTFAAISMNAWNRLGIAFRKPDPALAG
ncbi:carboxymuconolactone decarboxylase family protein [Lysobacter sp. TAB13]|uniref:carboxymuconolactone decarboxylase family protein n=1 Tax=Lysobacter sp. TAB13 TaxID=3233065 RepID=UPI003F947809